jgi:ferredoxin
MKGEIMEKDVYSKLCSHLNNHLVGCPETEEGLEILESRFTPEEAELALHVPPPGFAEDAATIAKAANKDEATVQELLELMCDKGTVKTIEQDPTQKGKYHLLSTIPGLLECSMSGKWGENEKQKRLAQLWIDYFDKGGFGHALHPGKVALTRIIPVESAIAPQLEVLATEHAIELVDSVEFISLFNCACRHATRLAGEGCGRSEETCMHFGDLAKYFTERGFAKRITKEQAKAILKKTDEEGLIHLTINTDEGSFAICSCCSCCCVQLKGLSKLHKPGSVATSRFFAYVDPDLCTAVGACEDRCHFDAMKIRENGIASADIEKCIGCGLCVSACPHEAISLKERPGYKKPISSMQQLAENFIASKAGQLD